MRVIFTAKHRCSCRYALISAALIFLCFGCNDGGQTFSTARQAIDAGWQDIGISRFDEAEAAFTRAASLAKPHTNEYFQARYGLANAYQHRRPNAKLDEARGVFKEVVELDKGGIMGAWSALALVRIEHLALYEVGRTPNTDDLEQTARSYKAVVDAFPNTPAADEAAIYVGTVWIEELAPAPAEKAIAWLNRWIAAHPGNTYLPAAYARVAAACEFLGKHREQLAALIASLGNDDDPFADRSIEYYRIAVIADKLVGDAGIARKYYQKMLDKYPNDAKVYWCYRYLRRLNGQPEGDAPLAEAAKQ